jgi:hypothetical protein
MAMQMINHPNIKINHYKNYVKSVIFKYKQIPLAGGGDEND